MQFLKWPWFSSISELKCVRPKSKDFDPSGVSTLMQASLAPSENAFHVHEVPQCHKLDHLDPVAGFNILIHQFQGFFTHT